MPSVSIIMTSYNYADYISEAIESVIKQTYVDWELIIVDDGSTDNSLEVINKYITLNPQKISLYTHPNNVNKGIKLSYELAFTKVTGKYVAFLESDDFWLENCLEMKVNALKKHNNACLAFSDLSLSYEQGFNARRYINYLKYSKYIGSKCQKKPKNILKMLLFRNPVVSFSNIVIKSEVLNGLILLEDHQIWSDWQLIIQSALIGDFIYVDQPLFFWRLHNKSSNFGYMNESIIEKNKDFKMKMSSIIQLKYSKTNPPKYPFTVSILFNKFFHDLLFSARYPNVFISEILHRIKL